MYRSNPIYGSYYEDYDLCQRVRLAGYRIGVVPYARIRHYSGSATDTPARERNRMRQILRNRTIYRLRFKADARLMTLIKVLLIEFPRRAIRRLVGRSGSQSLRSIWGAFRDLVMLSRRITDRERDNQEWEGWNRVSSDIDGRALWNSLSSSFTVRLQLGE